VKHLKEIHVQGRLQALLTNVRSGWKYLSGTNALAYFSGGESDKEEKVCEVDTYR